MNDQLIALAEIATQIVEGAAGGRFPATLVDEKTIAVDPVELARGILIVGTDADISHGLSFEGRGEVLLSIEV